MNTLFIIKHTDANDKIVSEEKLENVARITAMTKFLDIVEYLKNNKIEYLNHGVILLDCIEDKAILGFKLTENNF